MNSVAGQMVATMMNSKFDVQQSTGFTRSKANQDFSKVFRQANTNASEASKKNQKSENIPPKSTAEHSRNEQAMEKGIGQEVSEIATEANELKGLSEKVHVIKEELNNEVTHEVTNEVMHAVMDVEAILETTEGEALYDEVMTLVSQMFGIPLEELQNVLQEVKMDLLNLSDTDKLAEVVQTVFGHEGMAEMLLDDQSTAVFKAVHAEVEKLYEALNLDVDALAGRISVESVETKTPVEEAVKATVAQVTDNVVPKAETPVSDKGTNLEVIDVRDDAKISKYTQDKAGQNQGNQTFGELMSQHMTGLKETVSAVNSEQSEFQQFTTREVIDQIITKALVNLSTDKTSMQLQLNPEHLGKVAVSITAEQGVIKGQFVAENHMVKEMLEANMVQLKSHLEEQGIKVEKIEVTIGSSNQFFDQKDKGNQNKEATYKSFKRRVGHIQRMMLLDEVEMAEVNTQREAMTTLEDYTVEYSA